MTPSADYYELLGVSRNATAHELKAAYRRRARELHPDTNPTNPDAEERFKQVSEAYAVLRDPEKRALYDAYGPQGLRGWTTTTDDLFGSVFADFPDLADLFGSFFGRGRRHGPRVHRGDTLRVDVDLTLAQAYQGVTKAGVEVTRQRVCTACGGRGAEGETPPAACPACRGTGQVEQLRQGFFGMQISMAFTCTRCEGEGWVIPNPCRACEGTGVQRLRERLEVHIPAGVESGERLRLRGEGDAGARGGPAGDLIVVVHVRPDERFRRRGTELITTVALPFTTATLGGRLDIETLDGTTSVDIPPTTQPGSTIRVPGKGMPDPHTGRHGDLHVVLYVVVPRRLTRNQKHLLKGFRDAGGDTIPDDDDAKGFFERLRETLGRD